MSTTLSANDQRRRDSVIRQLSWDPDFDASMIGVAVKDGIATLTGYVETYAAKLAAERSARRVYGVRAVVNELEVRRAHARIDPDIARDVLEALKARPDVPPGIGVTVRDGFVTLTGKLDWMYQKTAAERAVRYLPGVRGVLNRIEIHPRVAAASPGE